MLPQERQASDCQHLWSKATVSAYATGVKRALDLSFIYLSGSLMASAAWFVSPEGVPPFPAVLLAANSYQSPPE